MRNIINIKDFLTKPTKNKDVSLPVMKALEYCKTITKPTLYFPEGQYHFFSTYTYEKLYYIANHDEDGLKRVAFSITCFDDLVIEGDNKGRTEFVFHGSIIPFVLESSHKIRICNINIDWERPRISQGRVISSCLEYMDIEINNIYPYKVIKNQLYFDVEGILEPFFALLEIDKYKIEPVPGSGDDCLLFEGNYKDIHVEEVKPSIIRFCGDFDRSLQVNNYVIMRHGKRVNPAIFIQDCKDTCIESTNIYHSGGMGVIAQKSENIHLEKMNVMRRVGSHRVFTLFADATHFVNCKGLVTIKDCLFENQLDDATNIHGIYLKIVDILDTHRIMVKLMHNQHKGVRVIGINDEVGFINPSTLLTYEKSRVKDIEFINSDFRIIRLNKALSSTVKINDCIENITWNPEVLIKGCTIRANRARGLLVSTPGDVVIEDNRISTPGAAIKISGDANLWYESGAVKHVIIRNNHFVDCNYCYGPWGRSVIDIDPEIKIINKETRSYHGDILIVNNIFETFSSELVRAHSVNNLCIDNNEHRVTTTYRESDCEVKTY